MLHSVFPGGCAAVAVQQKREDATSAVLSGLFCMYMKKENLCQKKKSNFRITLIIRG